MADNFDRFKDCAVKVLSVDADKVTLEASFADDLDADSLDLVELVMALEEEFDVTVEEESSKASPPSARPTSWSPASSEPSRPASGAGWGSATFYRRDSPS